MLVPFVGAMSLDLTPNSKTGSSASSDPRDGASVAIYVSANCICKFYSLPVWGWAKFGD
jgi:hypothetical protein